MDMSFNLMLSFKQPGRNMKNQTNRKTDRERITKTRFIDINNSRFQMESYSNV